MANAPRSIDAFRLEIVVLACSVLVLAGFLGIIVFLGLCVRNSTHRVRIDSESNDHDSPHREANTWLEDEANAYAEVSTPSGQIDHHAEYVTKGFTRNMWRLGSSFAGGLKRELKYAKKTTATASTAGIQTAWKEVEGTCAQSLRRLSDDVLTRWIGNSDRKGSRDSVRSVNRSFSSESTGPLVDVEEAGFSSATPTEQQYSGRRSSRFGLLGATIRKDLEVQQAESPPS